MVSKELDYDIVVVGGGPAGSSAAFAAAKNGVKVALLEKEECISQSVRTSGVTWVKDVKKFGIPPDCYNEIKNYSFCSPNNQVSVRDSKPRAVVLDVRKTYQWLAEHVDSDTWWLMVGQQYSPAGYAWIFPVSKNIIRIGVGVGKPESSVDPT